MDAKRVLYITVNGFVSIAVMAALAMFTHVPFVFPSLGPTAFMLFATPMIPAASPRHVLGGHLIGILCGYGALLVCGLADAQSVTTEGVNAARMLAAGLSLGATGGFMSLLRVAHPPAAATTMIVSLGFVHEPRHLVVIELGVALLAAQAFVINRLVGTRYPLWAPSKK